MRLAAKAPRRSVKERLINVLAVFSIIILFVGYEILLGLRTLIAPSGLIAYAERLQILAVRRIFSILGLYSGFKPVLEDRTGRQLPERFIFVANHQSLIDIPVVWRLIPESRRVRFVAKKELGAGVPFVSSCLRIQGHGLIQRRGSPVRTMRGLSRFARRCRRDGTCPVIFPEGTRSRDGRLGAFHTAGFRRIVETDSLPILVAAIEGGSKLAKLGDLFRNLGAYPYRVRLIEVLPAPAGKKEILAALEKSRELIAQALEELRAQDSSS